MELSSMEAVLAGRRPWWQLEVSAGALEALKWLALTLMVVDHVDAYLLGRESSAMYAAGRTVFPLFAFVFAFNLARPGNEAAADRAFARLLLFGLAAQFFAMALRRAAEPDGQWWQLNILMTFALCVPLIRATRGTPRWYAWALSGVVILILGAIVEFHWFGLLYVIAAYHFCARRTRITCAVWLASAGLLFFENGNAWALAAIPVIFAVGRISLEVPRLKWLFYAFYPAHLAGFWVLHRML